MSVNAYIARGTNPGAGMLEAARAKRNAFVQDRDFQAQQDYRNASMQSQQERAEAEHARGVMEQVMRARTPEQARALYEFGMQDAQRRGFDVSDAPAWEQIQGAYAPPDPNNEPLPAAPIQNYEYRLNLPEDQRDTFDTYVRAPQITDVNQVPTMVTPAGAKPLSTLEDETSAAGTIKSGEAAGAQAIKMSGEALQQIPGIDKSISNIDDAISALDSGAKTGVVYNKLPSFRQASVELQNVANRMGLDVVGAVTFGALSKGELDIALSTALPQNLEPKALREWLVKRKEAQLKLRNELVNAAIFLGTPGNTPAMWMEKNAKSDDLPKKGDVVDGFIFMGGDPAKQENWQKQ